MTDAHPARWYYVAKTPDGAGYEIVTGDGWDRASDEGRLVTASPMSKPLAEKWIKHRGKKSLADRYFGT